MDLFSVLLQPLILISGVALLIMSTVARLGQFETELRGLEADTRTHLADLRPHLLARVRRFRRALSSLYVSVALLALASLLGAVLHPFTERTTDLVLIVTCGAIVALLAAVVMLLAESRYAAELVERRISIATERREE